MMSFLSFNKSIVAQTVITRNAIEEVINPESGVESLPNTKKHPNIINTNKDSRSIYSQTEYAIFLLYTFDCIIIKVP
jgi:hypothetical protein